MCFAGLYNMAPAAGAAGGSTFLGGAAQLAPALIGAAGSAASAANQAGAQSAVLNYQRDVALRNADLAELQAIDALDQGTAAEMNLRQRTKRMKGAQRAAFAASGVALNEGSPVHVAASTDFMRDVDIATLRNNAARAAWGYRTQGANFRGQGAALRAGADAASPGASAFSSLLTKAPGVAAKWYDIYKQGGFGTSAPNLDEMPSGSSVFSSSGLFGDS